MDCKTRKSVQDTTRIKHIKLMKKNKCNQSKMQQEQETSTPMIQSKMQQEQHLRQ